jgi:hypothetical protein
MPLGLNRTGDNRNGNTVNWAPAPAHLGNAVLLPVNDGNPIPADGKQVNTVNWSTPNPAHFGNAIP